MHEGQHAHVWVPSYSYEQNGTPTNDTCWPLMHTAGTQQKSQWLQRLCCTSKLWSAWRCAC